MTRFLKKLFGVGAVAALREHVAKAEARRELFVGARATLEDMKVEMDNARTALAAAPSPEKLHAWIEASARWRVAESLIAQVHQMAADAYELALVAGLEPIFDGACEEISAAVEAQRRRIKKEDEARSAEFGRPVESTNALRELDNLDNQIQNSRNNIGGNAGGAVSGLLALVE